MSKERLFISEHISVLGAILLILLAVTYHYIPEKIMADSTKVFLAFLTFGMAGLSLIIGGMYYTNYSRRINENKEEDVK